jgi:hypothetical protein
MTESAASPAANPFTIPGTTRTYAVTAGSYVDVPSYDAELLVSQGWLVLAKNVIAGTSARPVNAIANTRVFDATVGNTIVSDGRGNWLNHSTGAVV